MHILGIETTCDETAVGILRDDATLRANVVASQAAIHANYGGIVPEIASRQHILAIRKVAEQALAEAQLKWTDISAIGVANGPGLAGSLLIGVAAAKALAATLRIPLIAVNHIEGHIAAAWIKSPQNPGAQQLQQLAPTATIACLVASGGHTEIVLMRNKSNFRIVGQTRDDAVGEAFDKVARLLGLRYPGGPEIQRVAQQAPGRHRFNLPTPLMRGSNDFSFSGIKTAVSREAAAWDGLPPDKVADLAAQFQATAVQVLVTKLCGAARQFQCSAMIIAGGVAANKLLRQQAAHHAEMPLFMPPIQLCTDNGAMIAARAADLLAQDTLAPPELEANPALAIPA